MAICAVLLVSVSFNSHAQLQDLGKLKGAFKKKDKGESESKSQPAPASATESSENLDAYFKLINDKVSLLDTGIKNASKMDDNADAKEHLDKTRKLDYFNTVRQLKDKGEKSNDPRFVKSDYDALLQYEARYKEAFEGGIRKNIESLMKNRNSPEEAQRAIYLATAASIMLPDELAVEQLLTAAKANYDDVLNGPKGELIFANAYYPDFETAKSHAIKEVKDGDPLWLYVRLEKAIDELVVVDKQSCKDGSVKNKRYLKIEIDKDPWTGGRETDWFYFDRRCELDDEFFKVDMKQKEFSVCLTTFKRNQSSSLFLEEVAGEDAKEINWKGKVKIFGEDPNKPFAATELFVNIEDGFVNYKKALKTFWENQFMGTIANNKLPSRGTFNDSKVRAFIADVAKTNSITPIDIYFSQNTWTAYREGQRSVDAVVRYKKGNDCFFSTLLIWENPTLTGYGDPYMGVPMSYGKIIPCK